MTAKYGSLLYIHQTTGTALNSERGDVVQEVRALTLI